MKRMLKRLSEKADRLAAKASEHKNKIVAAGTVALGTAQAQAALVAPTFAADDAITVGTAVLGGLALIWAIKKAMSMAH